MATEDFFRIQIEKTALLVIDMQRGFLDKGSVMEVPQGREIIPNIRQLVEAGRKRGVSVIFTQFVYSPKVPNLIGELHPEHKPMPLGGRPGFRKPSNCCLEGDSSTEVVADLAPMENEPVVQKHGYDAFFATDLEPTLRSRGVQTLVVTGVMTDICVLATVNSAVHREYRVLVVRDAVATLWPEVQQITLDLIERAYGRVVSTTEILKQMAEAPGLC
ncbi:MAG: hypothetical protein DRP97_05510 [Candidatus Latescibacterota bacterium]|nr:MAG: hypothetical protein DRP97_05510 [Candidatus Latescibacterota bacterium]